MKFNPLHLFQEKLAVRLTIILGIVAACFTPGLPSSFIFDDFPNLDALAHISDDTIASAGFWEYVLSGQAGPLGRPFSLFTFALQAGAWPDNPLAFKLVNLCIHCLSTLVVYCLCSLLAGVLGLGRKQSVWFCVFTSLLWGLNPVHSATVLYAVQRMALLSNLFMLVGITLYIHFRTSERLLSQPRGLLFLTLSLAITGLLALLSKENAPVLVFYLLTLEYSLLKDQKITTQFKKWRLVCLWLPAILIIMLPLIYWTRIQEGYQSSLFTPGERLLTQSRILWQYLATTIAPSTSGTSLFHDVSISSSLLNPITTLSAVIAWCALTVLVIFKPGKHHILRFALCWFFAGHIIESTILPLELFFNHRNYIAFLGPLIALVYSFLVLIPDRSLSLTRKQVIAVIYCGLMAFQLTVISNSWRTPLYMAESWYRADPLTSRNAEFYAIELARTGNEGIIQAALIYESSLERDQRNFRILMNRMILSCASPALPPPPNDLIRRYLELQDGSNRDLITPLQQLVSLVTNSSCFLYSPDFLKEILYTLVEVSNEKDAGLYEFELAKLEMFQQNNSEAVQLMRRAYENNADPGVLFNLSILLVNMERYEEALQTIDSAITLLDSENNIRTGTRAQKLARLQEIRNDIIAFMEGSAN